MNINELLFCHIEFNLKYYMLQKLYFVIKPFQLPQAPQRVYKCKQKKQFFFKFI